MFYHDSFIPNAISGAQLDTLLSLGWYRMNQSVFCTSHIEHGNLPFRVHWLRYPIAKLRPLPSHKRIRNRNKKFNFSIEDFVSIRTDHAELHRKYRESITFNGALSILDCLFGEHPTDKNIFNTKCISVFDQDKLIAGGYFDLGCEGAASILHFFDPQYRRYSLGKFLILLTVDYLENNRFAFYYPGYVVAGLSKMNYKLFLGKETSQYFDPVMIGWEDFRETILLKESTSLEQASDENSQQEDTIISQGS